MTKIVIISGFLGAGKTTLIKKLIAEAYAGEKLVLIENEFGEIAVDGGFLRDAGVQINEMSSGCICCSLVGDFTKALRQVKEQFAPDRILIEPSGVGKLSDVIRAVESVKDAGLELGSAAVVVDALRAKMHLRNFGEFWCDQVENAGCILLSRTAGMAADRLAGAVALLREKNPGAVIVTTSWDELDGKALRAAMEKTDSLQAELAALEHAHHYDHGESCGCGHDHHEHHHDHDEACACGHDHHEHHHGHDEACACGHDHHEHDHHHDHGHAAGEVFASWGTETPETYRDEELHAALRALDTGAYGQILRAKGYVSAGEGWLHFDFVPGEEEVRPGPAGVTGRICVIGAGLDRRGLKELFKVG